MNSLPHVQRTCEATYSGWMSVFIVRSSLPSGMPVPGRSAGRERAAPARDVAALDGLLDAAVGVDGRDDRLRRRAGERDDGDRALLAGIERTDLGPAGADAHAERARRR